MPKFDPKKMVIVENNAPVQAGKTVFIVSGGYVHFESFITILVGRGLASIRPARPTERAAFSRALEKVKPSDVRKTSLGRGRWAAHRKQHGSGELALDWVQEFGGKLVDGRPWIDNADPAFMTRLNAEFDYFLDNLTPDDVRAWIRDKLAGPLEATAYNGGHNFFVPSAKVLLLEQLTAVIQQIGYDLPSSALMSTDNVLQNVLQEFRSQAMKELGLINEFLDAQTDPNDLTTKQLQARKVKEGTLEQLRQKIERAEKIFMAPLYDLLGQVQDIKNKAAWTSIKVDNAAAGFNIAVGNRQLELDNGPTKAQVAPITQEWDATDQRFSMMEIDDDKPKAPVEPEPEEEGRKVDIDDDE